VFGAGSQELKTALAFGGVGTPPASALTEFWDGTSWTEVADLATARKGIGAFGISTSAVAASGATPTRVTDTEEWLAPTGAVVKTFTTS
jgi:hypothetical protein